MPSLIKPFFVRCFQIAAAHLGKHRFTLVEEPEMVILMYHRVLPLDDERTRFEEPGMTVTPESFDIHLATLKDEIEIMSLDDWVERKQTGQTLPRRCCTITFDDGWADNYEYAFPLLEKHGVPATIFLATDFIGTERMFWPERVARLLVQVAEECADDWEHPTLDWVPREGSDYAFDNVPPDREQISGIISSCKHMRDEQIHRHVNDSLQALGLELKPGRVSMLNWNQVERMAQSKVVEFGSHTCSHTRLNAYTPVEELEHQVIDSKKKLKKVLNTKVELFSIPNLDYTEEVLECVIRNYNAAVTASSGWNVKSSDSYRLQRIGIHQDNAHDRIALLSRLSDWM